MNSETESLIREKLSQIGRVDASLNVMANMSAQPGPRYRSEGEGSGEEFRDVHLIPAFDEAIARGVKLWVLLDGAEYGYPTSFLEEAFGGLARQRGRETVKANLEILCIEEPLLKYEVEHYVTHSDGSKPPSPKHRPFENSGRHKLSDWLEDVKSKAESVLHIRKKKVRINLDVMENMTAQPGPRFRTQGEGSGEGFREDYLIPAFDSAIEKGAKLHVDLDGAIYGYPTSFLEEAFGGLARQRGRNTVMSNIEFECTDEPLLEYEIGYYICHADEYRDPAYVASD